jgi:Lsr2
LEEEIRGEPGVELAELPFPALLWLLHPFRSAKAGPMQITIDSSDSLENAIRVVGSLYGVELTVTSSGAVTGSEGSETATAQAPATASGRASKKAAAGKRTTGRSRRSEGSGSAPSDLAAVRAWARDNGFQVSDRGRVSNTVLEAYRQRASSS